MTLNKLSEKQKLVLRWCHMPGTRDKYSALVCDGAVRSGKTVCMVVSFILWAMRFFDGATFGICGKTVQSAERNIIMLLQTMADITAFYDLTYSRSAKLLTVTGAGRSNRFYVFGGKDESSYMLIQGITLSGVLFDEVALMPRSFVEQAIARTLSVPTAKLWFNCNPEGPQHWFYQEWILHPQEDVLHLHFLMQDNPVMDAAAIAKAEARFQGVFYDRYIRGLWVLAEGRIYDMFDHCKHVVSAPPAPCSQYYVSMDYGTQNPTAMLLWGKCKGAWYLIREYYHSGRATHRQKTDEEYCDDLEALVGNLHIRAVIVDPSAASMIACIRRRGRFLVIPADNAVVDGIRVTATAFSLGNLFLCDRCENTLAEIDGYVWDDKAADRGEDKPLKINDHAMDAMRYFCMEVFGRNSIGPITIGGR